MKNKLVEAVSNEQLIGWFTTDEKKYPLAMGCPQCPQIDTCGGLHVNGPIYDCSDLCCEDFENCSIVCKRRDTSGYVNQVREVGGYEFDNIEVSPPILVDLPSGVYPIIYHGYSRSSPNPTKIAGLRLSDLISFKQGSLKYSTAEQLREAFNLSANSKIIVSGVLPDKKIENWWRLGERRLAIIKGMKALGLELVTAPNYSAVLDLPRTNDLHSLKRIAITCSEFSRSGIACALHPNGRTRQDFVRWGKYVRDHTDISVLAYEFITGPGRKSRLDFHLSQLAVIRRIADRPLSIVVRGNSSCIPVLRNIFENVTYLESTSFVRTLRRQEAYINNRNKIRWRSRKTQHGQPVDSLLDVNIKQVKNYTESVFFYDRSSNCAAA